MLYRYGKSSNGLIGIKQSFFQDNTKHLKRAQRVADIYKGQPKRVSCKACSHPLNEICFEKMGVEYFICERCNHLNGGHEDTEEFVLKLYVQDEGREYAEAYKEETKADYLRRVETIYTPKSEFLMESLLELGEEPKECRVTDFGCGSGYFLYAMESLGFKRIEGYEVSETQVNFGNSFFPKNYINRFNESETMELCSNLQTDILSLVGVVEHLRDPQEFFSTVSSNRNIKYVFMSVPLFSLSVFLELAFKNVMPRHLAGGHTHLFTKESLFSFVDRYGFSVVAEWWFGLDVMDLFRSLLVTINDDQNSEKAASLLNETYVGLIDELQYVIDKNKLSSEIHFILKKEAQPEAVS